MCDIHEDRTQMVQLFTYFTEERTDLCLSQGY